MQLKMSLHQIPTWRPETSPGTSWPGAAVWCFRSQLLPRAVDSLLAVGLLWRYFPTLWLGSDPDDSGAFRKQLSKPLVIPSACPASALDKRVPGPLVAGGMA